MQTGVLTGVVLPVRATDNCPSITSASSNNGHPRPVQISSRSELVSFTSAAHSLGEVAAELEMSEGHLTWARVHAKVVLRNCPERQVLQSAPSACSRESAGMVSSPQEKSRFL